MIEKIMAFSSDLDQVFAKRGWLSEQTPALRRLVLDRCRRIGFDAGENIVRIGDDGGGIYGIVSGSVGSIAMTKLAGPTLGHIMRPGIWFGEGPLLTGRQRTMTFRAMEETDVVLVPLAELRPQMASDLAFAGMIAQMTEELVRSSIEVACELLIKDAPRRLAATILRVTAVLEGVAPASEQGFRITQTDLGEMSGLSRNHTNRILNDLQASGIVTLGYNHIQIANPEGLVAFVRRGDNS